MTRSNLKSWTALAAALAAALTFGLPALAQDNLPTLSESVEVRVVNVEAVVTDRAGTRVTDLDPADFRLLVDGEEVPIEFFTEVRGGAPIAGPGRQGAIAPAVASGEGVGTSYLVFVDEFFTIARDRQRVLAALESQVGHLGPDDRMAIVAWDGRDLDMITAWTGSVAQLSSALDLVAQRPSKGLQRLAERRRFDTDRSAAGRFFLARDPRLEIEERYYAELLTEQTERAIQAAAATLRGFGTPPGRRVMMLLSGGWPYSPTEFVLGPRVRTAFDPALPEGREIFAPLTEAANLLGYTLYPVDVPGFQTTSGTDASLASPGGSSTGLDFYRETELHHGLQFIARETGGRALVNRQREDAMGTVFQDTRSYYWLGFTPAWTGDGEEHSIEVEVSRDAFDVRTRKGYSDLSRQNLMALSVESALLFGDPATRQPMAISVGVPTGARWGKLAVPVTLEIPADDLAWLPTADGYMATLELYVAARDRSGSTAEVPVETILLTRATLPSDAETIRHDLTLRIRRQPHDIAFAVHDAAGGATLSAATRIVL